jgi:hypothetical protein
MTPTMDDLIAAVGIWQTLRDRHGDDLTVDQLAALSEEEKSALLNALRVLRPAESLERMARAMWGTPREDEKN